MSTTANRFLGVTYALPYYTVLLQSADKLHEDPADQICLKVWIIGRI